jgi:DNA-binding NarL/FixJ family response regulator
VLIYSAHGRPDFVRRCASLGACGYVSKRAEKQKLVVAIRDAFAGKEVWDESEPMAACEPQGTSLR